MPSKQRKAQPVVVLVGRPNVGKSTLFNRVIGSRRAIVTPVPGTTRDVLAQPAEWRGRAFELIDTGGMFGHSQDPLQPLAARHGRRALASADVIVFVTDAREGLVPGDEEIAQIVRPLGVPVLVTANKVDDRRSADHVHEFHTLGFAQVLQIAAEHGDGVADLLDEIVERLPTPGQVSSPETEAEAGPAEIRVAIVGRPNVGKSSLVNRLVRQERMIVNEVPGTTRDAVDVALRWHRRDFRIFDTAGIRKPGRVARAGQVEAVSIVLARRAIARADVAVLVVDASQGAVDQDATIAGEAERAGCGVIIAANKWDLVKAGDADVMKQFDENLRFRLKFLDYAPILHLSALTGERTARLIEMIDRVADARSRRVATAELNRFVEEVVRQHPPASPGRKDVRILYAAQTGVAPPTFVLFTNVATKLHFSYERFLVNRLRETFGFVGTPVRLVVRRRRR